MSSHPIVLDLGNVIGPRGLQGPPGRSMIVGSGDPAPDMGSSDGDTYLDTDSGTIWIRQNGVWTYVGPFAPTTGDSLDVSDMSQQRTRVFFENARCVFVREGNVVQLDFYKEATGESGDPTYSYVYPATESDTDTRSFGIVVPEAIRPIHTVQALCRFTGAGTGICAEGPCILASTGEMHVPHLTWLATGSNGGCRICGPGTYVFSSFFVQFTYVTAGPRSLSAGQSITIDPETGERVTEGPQPHMATPESFDFDLGGGQFT